MELAARRECFSPPPPPTPKAREASWTPVGRLSPFVFLYLSPSPRGSRPQSLAFSKAEEGGGKAVPGLTDQIQKQQWRGDHHPQCQLPATTWSMSPNEADECPPPGAHTEDPLITPTRTSDTQGHLSVLLSAKKKTLNKPGLRKPTKCSIIAVLTRRVVPSWTLLETVSRRVQHDAVLVAGNVSSLNRYGPEKGERERDEMGICVDAQCGLETRQWSPRWSSRPQAGSGRNWIQSMMLFTQETVKKKEER